MKSKITLTESVTRHDDIDDILILILPLEEDCTPALEENLEPNTLVLGACELEDFGTSLWGRATLLGLRRDHYLLVT